MEYSSPERPLRRKRQDSILIVLLGVLLSCICMSMTGFALYLGGYNPLLFPFQLTATAMAEQNASCKVLIEEAIQASGSFCGETDSNNVCYGNTTIQAELVPGARERFSERGDVVGVNVLRRLSAAPLDLESNEWGIAVFKVIANLPRSLPGETVTMIVFGNTSLENESGNLESFYFFSELGQISCEAVPFDGLMITSPDGTGMRINVNGAELTLMGSASLKAVKNGEMDVSLFDGSGRLVANGQEQYFGAGQKVRVGLGGENGTEAITGPSGPEPLSQAELNTACSLTGQYCSPGEIIPVSAAEAQQQLQGHITFTPTALMSRTPSATPSPSMTPTSTILVLPSWTPTRTPTRTITPITPSSTPITPTNTPTRTNTPITPSSTPITPTNTPITPTNTPITPTNTPITPTSTPTGPTDPICSDVGIPVSLSNPSNTIPNELAMTITNGNPVPITITRVYAEWVKSPVSQKLDKLFLKDVQVWNISDNDSPSDIPAESSFMSGADLTVPDGIPVNFMIQFLDDLQAGDYKVSIVFDTVPSCQAQTSFTVP